ncbi:hypothetical protein AQJ58_25220 [Streptomyces sp. DSM 15324]|nr:hypothetical protein AQJ58_25220 [Streptomyces sp. DSM 15324]
MAQEGGDEVGPRLVQGLGVHGQARAQVPSVGSSEFAPRDLRAAVFFHLVFLAGCFFAAVFLAGDFSLTLAISCTAASSRGAAFAWATDSLSAARGATVVVLGGYEAATLDHRDDLHGRLRGDHE